MQPSPNADRAPGAAAAEHAAEPVEDGNRPVRTSWPPVSVIMPVLNEERHLAGAVRRVLAQEYLGAIEVVLAVGPSKDRTAEVAAGLAADDPRVQVVDNPTGRTPAALNAAIGASGNPIIARVDGHALLPGDYLARAVEALETTGADNVGGVMAAEGETAFEQAVARAMTSRFGVGNASFHTGGRPGPADTVYLGVFRRSALERVGGYDEAYVRAQDWEMNHRIRRSGGLIWFEPAMRVTYRPRPNLRALAKQYYHYGRWRRVVARRHHGTVNARYLAPPAAVLLIVAGVVVGCFGIWPGWIAPGGYLLGTIAAAALSAHGLPLRSRLLLPPVFAAMHLPWGVGFLTSPRRLGTHPNGRL